ncbi:PAS domain S-box protein [Psychroflexus sp. CAK1W]|uniref:sensor histidine kinase n=1 Tax=Psychroflexus curvus TaxID=2873595 RepID=UPI001CCDB7C8|nr:ATP-binding protein [Psychroflexus curvus]MBZ9627414.1 PAS domain S-box protein [Psychroflexus curvus]
MNTQTQPESAEDLYQNAPFGYLSMRNDGLIVNINATLLKWLGYASDEIIMQKSFHELLTVGGKMYFETHMRPLLEMQSEVSEINIEFKTATLTRLPTLVNAKLTATGLDSKPVYRLSVLDITQRKQYELEMKIAREKAEQSVQRLKQINKELEQFAYTASHDLQAPLNNITGLMSLLENNTHDSAESEEQEYYSLIRSNTQSMKMMIKDLLDYSRIDSTETNFDKVSLNDVCESAKELIGDEINRNNASFQIADLPEVYGDRIKLVRLFLNIFSNAIKYRSEDDPLIKVDIDVKGNEVKIFVKDNGMGFKMDKAEQIFGFMKRLHGHSSIPGTGIGLSACKRIVEIHRGTIGVQSEPGKGSTFYFTLMQKEV